MNLSDLDPQTLVALILLAVVALGFGAGVLAAASISARGHAAAAEEQYWQGVEEGREVALKEALVKAQGRCGKCLGRAAAFVGKYNVEISKREEATV